MIKKNAIRRQFWQIRHLGLGHVFAKVRRRIRRPRTAVPSPEAELIARVLGASSDRATHLQDMIRELDVRKRAAFEDGRFAEYVEIGREIGVHKDQWADSLGLNPRATRIIGSSFFGPLGHIAQLDYYAKARLLGVSGCERTVILADRDRIPNPALFELWTSHFHVEYVSSRDWADAHLLCEPIAETADFVQTGSSREPTMFYWDAVNRSWESEGHAPRLALPEDIVDRGNRAMEKMGVPRGAWYVCFHVREGDHRMSYRGPNARVETYVEAMAEVVRRGGYAIRMGDADMTPLPNMPGVIDYAHAVQRADWLDVYLWATCRFFVGTGSGPIHIPGTFGVPVLMTNTSAVGMFVPYSTGAMMITKHMIDMSTTRELNIGEALARGVGWNWSADFSRHGVRLEDNSASEIRDAVVDMFDAVDGKRPSHTAGQTRFDEMRRSAGSAITTPCAPSFAERFV